MCAVSVTSRACNSPDMASIKSLNSFLFYDPNYDPLEKTFYILDLAVGVSPTTIKFCRKNANPTYPQKWPRVLIRSNPDHKTLTWSLNEYYYTVQSKTATEAITR